MSNKVKHAIAYAIAIGAAISLVVAIGWIDQKHFAPKMKEAIEFQNRLKKHSK